MRTHEKVEKKENEYDPDYVEREVEIASTEVTTDKELCNLQLAYKRAGHISIKTMSNKTEAIPSLGGFIWVPMTISSWPTPAWVSTRSVHQTCS